MSSYRVNGVRLTCQVHGRGRPLLFVHGFPLSGEMWQPILPLLQDVGKLIVPDLRGFGGSEATPDAEMADYADDLAALLDALGEKQPAVVVGLSMGGYVAFEFHRRHRARVAALVLADTRAEGDTAESAKARLESADQVAREGSRIVGDAMVEKLFAAATPATVKETWRGLMAAADPVGVAAALRAMSRRTDFRPLLSDIQAPTLIIVGAEDSITPVDGSRGMHEAIGGSQLEIIPGAGHMPPVEQPEAFARVVRKFIETLE